MSVHQESLDMPKPIERAEDAPELEYKAVSHDSLSMFLAAIGGAILGMLLTLLILALINGGTLSFSGGERLTVFESKLQAVDSNVNAVSHNVDAVSQQALALQNQLGAVETALRSELSTQGANVANLSSAIGELDKTRQQFNTFIGALSDAMAAMNSETAAAPAQAAAPAVEPAVVEAAPAEVELPALTVENSADVAAGALAVVLFVDANANGTFDEGEAKVEGATVNVTDSAGTALTGEQNADLGLLFSDLAAGDYQVAVEDAAGHTLLSAAQADVSVAEGASEGQILYVPVAAE
jgi:hypothetical protein